METIRILSESAATGMRLRDILYQAGYAEITCSVLTAVPDSEPADIFVIYAKTHISDVMQFASDCNAAIILLLNPDCYARHLDRARHIGIKLLLMPVSPEMLLDAVRDAIA